MKKLFLLLLLVTANVLSQEYYKEWENVVTHENDGDIKAAAQDVAKIYKNAVRDRNQPQIIKSFFYTSKYFHVLEENAQEKIMQQLAKEITVAPPAAKAILNLVYAKCLQQFFNNNRWLIYQRTSTDSITGNFQTWAAKDFENEISRAYARTLVDKNVLKQTPLTAYEAIFDIVDLQQAKTLLSYMLIENIEYHQTLLSDTRISASKYLSFKPSLYGDSEAFTTWNAAFVTKDIFAKTLQLYQELEKTEPSGANRLARVNFIHDYILKDTNAYLLVLNHLQQQSNDAPLIQKILLQKGNTLLTLAETNQKRNHNLLALQTFDSILAIGIKNRTYHLATIARGQILTKSLSVQLEKTTFPGQNNRARISFRNIDSISVQYFKIDTKSTLKFGDYYLRDSIAKSVMASSKATVAVIKSLPNKMDYLEYSTDILLPLMPVGQYLVVFQNLSPDTENIVQRSDVVTVSNFAMTAYSQNQHNYYQVVDRRTGHPIEDVTISTTNFRIKTDRDGMAIYGAGRSDNYNRDIGLEKDIDTLILPQSYPARMPTTRDLDDLESEVKLYLDRAIYRPGQTVYYKGIAVIEKPVSGNSVVANTSFKFTVSDADYSDFLELDVRTNEFGSFTGEFKLPSDLTGEFTIEISKPDNVRKDARYDKIEEEHPFWHYTDFNASEITFRVEEYKRPKFEVRFNTPKTEYAINDSIKFEGSARAFSGSMVSGAKVSYRVVRTSFPKWWSPISDAGETISTGIIETDAAGNFTVTFVAAADPTLPKEELPVFQYVVIADVTDANGETQSATDGIKVGYNSLQLNAIVPFEMEIGQPKDIPLSSTNLNGETVIANVKVEAYYLGNAALKFKDRTFGEPELEIFTEEEFNKLFPFEHFRATTTNAGQLVSTTTINTATDQTINLQHLKIAGEYRLEISAIDSKGNIISIRKNIRLVNTGATTRLLSIKQLNPNPKKDGYVRLGVYSPIAELSLFYSSRFGENEAKTKIATLRNHALEIKVPVDRTFSGEMVLSVDTVFDNVFFTESIIVDIAEERPLPIFEVTTFRNKLEPGVAEKWSFQLKNSDEAEVLASMYDLSLDQFHTAEWTSPGLQQSYSSTLHRTFVGNQNLWLNFNFPNNLISSNYDSERNELIWFGFSFIDDAKGWQAEQRYKSQITKKSKKPRNATIISGVVSDAAGPIPGANVIVQGTQRGVQTDIDGRYEIEAAPGEVLVFSYLGMTDATSTVRLSTVVNIILEEGKEQLSEVVVTAYGIKRTKKELAYSTSEVKNALDQESNPEAITTLAGRVSGLNITTQNGSNRIILRGSKSLNGEDKILLLVIDGTISNYADFQLLSAADIATITMLGVAEGSSLYGSDGAKGVMVVTTKKAANELAVVHVRKNLSETAFFFPHLKTDASGRVQFSFTSPEALTQWKFRMISHTKDLKVAKLEKLTVTQKELMVVPNLPRFVRENDTIVISAKISNLTNEAKNGIVSLQLSDAANMQNIDPVMLNLNPIRNFSAGPKNNTAVTWRIIIPEGLQGIQFKVVAKSGSFSDGEESTLPVLTNRMLVTETVPIWVRENATKNYVLPNLRDNNSSTLRHHQMVLEYTSNPTWLAIQSLPYLMEYEHECSEQTFARFYANSLAAKIIADNPKIAEIFAKWKLLAPTEQLEKNAELKSILLAETPWSNDLASEDEKKRNLAMLFDLDKMKTSLDNIFRKLENKQSASGGFPWFDGGADSEFITRHIVAGLGHLQKLNVESGQFAKITKTAIPYLDKKYSVNKEGIDKPTRFANYSDLHYLYMRSFFLTDYPINEKLKALIDEQLNTTSEHWQRLSLYEKATAALVLHRFGRKNVADKIIESLKQTSSNNDDWGMYWIENKSGYYWHQAPIETQALLIEAFAEVASDIKSVDAMKVWLLKNKQNKNWPTTKATTEAVYALVSQGSDWKSVKDNTKIKIGDSTILTKKISETEKEAETGYLKLTWSEAEITKDMANASIENNSNVPAFGGLYWQYFEELDKIKTHGGNVMHVEKGLYLKKNTSEGQELQRITNVSPLRIGDLVTVRLTIVTAEDMEYVHLKDMRASCFEPVDVLSENKREGGLNFYTSTKDVATHFFFDTIVKGTYVLEYDIRVNNEGDFSNGITTIQSMYAPEFSSHTKGIRVTVKP